MTTSLASQDGVSVSLDHLLSLRFQAKALDLNSRRHLSHHRIGDYLSRAQGRGMDYDESRIYQAGDDIRHMDWKVTARSGRAHTKLYREERERPVFIVVDFNPSMYFGTRVAFKSVIAAQAASLLAWAADQRGDRVGGLLFSGEKHREFRPQTRQHGVLSLINGLVEMNQPSANQQAAPLSSVLKRLRQVVKPGCLILLLSDFNTLDKDSESQLSQLAQHNELYAGMVYDPLEVQLPNAGIYNFRYHEQRMRVDLNQPQLQHAYQQQFLQQQQAVKTLLAKRSMLLFPLPTHRPVLQSLQHGLQGVEAISVSTP